MAFGDNYLTPNSFSSTFPNMTTRKITNATPGLPGKTNAQIGATDEQQQRMVSEGNSMLSSNLSPEQYQANYDDRMAAAMAGMANPATGDPLPGWYERKQTTPIDPTESTTTPDIPQPGTYNAWDAGILQQAPINAAGAKTDDTENIFQPDKFSNSYSGIGDEYNKQLMDAVIPKLLESLENYESNIDKSTKSSQELYQSQSKQAIEKELQNILNGMGAKNMLNSSVIGDTMSKSTNDIVKNYADKSFEASMLGAGMKANLPALLANITNLGKYSYSEDPLQPYQLMAQYDWATM